MAAVNPEQPEPTMITLRMLSVIEIAIDSLAAKRMRKRTLQPATAQETTAGAAVNRIAALRILTSERDF